MERIFCKASPASKPTRTAKTPSTEKLPRKPEATIKVAQSLAIQQLVQRFRLFSIPLPLRVLQSKKSPSLNKSPYRKSIPCQRDKKELRLVQDRLQFGHTLFTLREFFPSILQEDWPAEILSEDVVLLDGITPRFNLTPFNAFGKKSYLQSMWILRLGSFLLCKQTVVEMLRFWQPCKETILIRWSVKIYPRLLYNISGTIVQIDGISEFKLNQRGKIYQHSVDISDHHNVKFDLHFQSFIESRSQVLTNAGV
eukprot:g8631.t1